MLLCVFADAFGDIVYRKREKEGTIMEGTGTKKQHKTIEELFEGFEGEYIPEEIDWGEDVWREIW